MREIDPFKGTFRNLQDLVDKIKDVLNCPVTIEDSNHRLLAYSTHDDLTDLARIGTIVKRKVPEKIVNRLWKDGIIPKLMQSEELVSIPEIKEIGLGHRIAISIQNKNEVLGYMWLVQESANLTDQQKTLLKKAVKVAKNELLKLHTHKKKKDENHQNFFWQLLTGQFLTHDEILLNYQYQNLVPPTQFAVLVFQFQDEISGKLEENITYLLKTSQKIVTSFYLIMGNELILIAVPPKSMLTQSILSEFIDNFISQMKSRFSIHHLQGSSGTIYHRLDKIVTSYQEALTVHRLKLQLKEELKDVIHYQQLGIFRYLEAIIDRNKCDPYMNPVIEKLEQYDRINKTNLLETLEVFISHDSNINDAAKKLHVHSNTLNYRVKRIMEIGDLDLKNASEKMALYLDLLVRRMEKNSRL